MHPVFRQLQSCATETLKQSCLYRYDSTVSKQDYLKIKSFFSLNGNLLRMSHYKIHSFKQLNLSCSAGIFIYQILKSEKYDRIASLPSSFACICYIGQGIVSLKKYVLISRIVSLEIANKKEPLVCPYCKLGLQSTIVQKVNNIQFLLN